MLKTACNRPASEGCWALLSPLCGPCPATGCCALRPASASRTARPRARPPPARSPRDGRSSQFPSCRRSQTAAARCTCSSTWPTGCPSAAKGQFRAHRRPHALATARNPLHAAHALCPPLARALQSTHTHCHTSSRKAEGAGHPTLPNTREPQSFTIAPSHAVTDSARRTDIDTLRQVKWQQCWRIATYNLSHNLQTDAQTICAQPCCVCSTVQCAFLSASATIRVRRT